QIWIACYKANRVLARPLPRGRIVPTLSEIHHPSICIHDATSVAFEVMDSRGGFAGDLAEGVVDQVVDDGAGGIDDVADRAEIIDQRPSDRAGRRERRN